jgi:hypothetical protein
MQPVGNLDSSPLAAVDARVSEHLTLVRRPAVQRDRTPQRGQYHLDAAEVRHQAAPASPPRDQ